VTPGPDSAAAGGGRLVVLCGLPGSGKTTTARRIAGESGGVRFCPDEWMTALQIDLWDQTARDRVEALQWELAQELLASGLTVIIEWGVWSRAERDVLRERARELGVRVELIYLDVPVDVLLERLEARNVEQTVGTVVITRQNLLSWVPSFEAPSTDELALFDS
jgi:predicted kinase